LPSEADGLEGRPEAKNLVGIYAAFANETVDDTLTRFGGQGFGSFKPALAEIVVEHLRPISERFSALKDDHEQIDAALAKGAAKARELSAPTLKAAYAALGLLR
jgi:tryptophanyl-tRNA synthetase